MYPIRIFGQGGKSIEEIWKGGAKAFYGVNVPYLPNFGMLYGPNTNSGHNRYVGLRSWRRREGSAGWLLITVCQYHFDDRGPVEIYLPVYSGGVGCKKAR